MWTLPFLRGAGQVKYTALASSRRIKKTVVSLYQGLEIGAKGERMFYYLLIVDIESGAAETLPLKYDRDCMPRGLLAYPVANGG